MEGVLTLVVGDDSIDLLRSSVLRGGRSGFEGEEGEGGEGGRFDEHV